MNISRFVTNGRLSIIAKPNSKKTEVLGYDDERKAIRIAIAAPPEDNKANKEIVRFVSKELKRKVLIERGLTSKEKLLRIEE